ncbi:metallophosphoesterase [Paracoccus beibuensis]|uniref:metallophosphoesterase n=1 Tax=Paracoccus beibuensis TaxID=547602 RepID=UPI002240A82C|nr:metallophosphoesterase [Paracoccus beibuensis]
MGQFTPQILTLHAITLCIGLIVGFRFVYRLSIGRPFRYLLVGLVLIVSLNRLFSQLLLGSLDPIDLPRPLIVTLSWLFASVLMLTVSQVALDVVTALRSLVARRLVRPAAWVRWTMGAGALSLSALGVSQALQVPNAKVVEITLEGLPEEFDGYRILQLTDLHVSHLFPGRWLSDVVAVANDQRADLVAITGDVVDGIPATRQDDLASLRLLQAKDGVFMVPGNHEYYFDYVGWIETFQVLGLRPLLNGHVVIRRGSAEMVLAGVTDPVAAGHGHVAPNIREALAGKGNGVPVVLLAHQPQLARRAAQAGVDLQLSGHTHGGMAIGLRRLVGSLNGGFVSGLYKIGNMRLYVSNGTGHTPGFAFRFGVPPEMTVVVLRPA